jgi:hypothetical protein
VFDAFVAHKEARVARGDLAPSPLGRIGRFSITHGGRRSAGDRFCRKKLQIGFGVNAGRELHISGG